MRIPLLMSSALLLLLFAAATASAQTPGLCSAIADRAARMECLGQPATRAPAPQPPPIATSGCTPASPCSDSRGRYYTTRSGGKRYVRRP